MTSGRLTQFEACRRLHSKLLALGIPPGHSIPRPRWDALVVQSMQVGITQARNLTATGEAAGFWVRIEHHGRRPGAIQLAHARAPPGALGASSEAVPAS